MRISKIAELQTQTQTSLMLDSRLFDIKKRKSVKMEHFSKQIRNKMHFQFSSRSKEISLIGDVAK